MRKYRISYYALLSRPSMNFVEDGDIVEITRPYFSRKEFKKCINALQIDLRDWLPMLYAGDVMILKTGCIISDITYGERAIAHVSCNYLGNVWVTRYPQLDTALIR